MGPVSSEENDLTGSGYHDKLLPMSIVKVTKLNKSYGSLKAVDGISFSVEPCEIFGLLGPNGAGKTTTLECIEGLRSFNSGKISVLNMNPETEGHALRKRIGMQLQESALPDDIKVWEAMDLYASFYKSPIDWHPLLDQLGLREKKNARFSRLSGGQKQRLYIALALVNDPEVFFFDELTTGLDPQARRTVWDLVREVRDRGKTVVLTTHLMDEAETLCDRLIIIDHGHIIAEGTPDSLIREQQLESRVLFSSDAELADDTFSSIPSVRRFEKTDKRYVISGHGDLLIKEVIDFMVEHNIHFQDIRSEHATLEDVFLSLTGRRIRE